MQEREVKGKNKEAKGKKERKAETEKETDSNVSSTGVARKECKGEDCPVCMEELDETKEELVWCKAQCGQNLHKECFNIWSSQSRSGVVSCVYCRADWVGDGVNLKKKKKNTSGGAYMNFAEDQGL